MSSPAEPRSAVLRFLDAFLQERNIKWMLGIGILILLGSSLMLVTAHWESYTPVWKYLILLGYTAGIHGLGQLSYHSLALRKTGTGLMALTVLLIPLTFLGLHWVQPVASLSGLSHQLGLIALLAVTAVFALLAARRIFHHFLRGPQLTFLASYAVLASAGAIVPSLPASASPFVTLVLWIVFAVGATKVNRHVFWLTEEHRLPRIYGFVPILLLGGMFLTLFAAGLAPHVSLAWIGFGLVLTAVPVLLTADALAHVFQQRNVTMPRPLPWSIVLPIFLGITMSITGVCLSGIGFPNTASLPLTAALAAIVIAVVARRTGRQEFVWLTLAAVTAAYQTSPVFFQELARTAVREGAAAVHEQKLPYAFYGLTYLPLLIVCSGLSSFLKRRDDGLFSIPLRRFSIATGVVLLLACVTHAKALFPVGLALMGLFGLQLVLFRDRRLLLPAVAAFVLSGIGFETFSEQVLLLPSSIELPLLAWAITGGLLLWPGRVIGRATSAKCVADTGRWNLIPICQWTSLAALIVTAAVWLVRAAWFGEVAVISGLLCGALLMVHAWQFTDRRIARLAISNLALLFAVLAAHTGWSFAAVMAMESLLLFGLWMTGRGLRSSQSPKSMAEQTAGTKLDSQRVLRLAGSDVAAIGLCGIALLYALPTMAVTILTGVSFSAWLAAAVCLIWTIDAARVRQSVPLTVVAWLLSLGTLGVLSAAAFGWQSVHVWYPALGTLLPTLVIWLIRPHSANTKILSGLQGVLRIWAVATLAVVAMGSLVIFTVPMRVAGIAALTGLLWSAARWPDVRLRTAAFSIAGWQLLAAVLQVASPHWGAINELLFPLAPAIALSVALAAAGLAILWNTEWMKQRTITALNEVQCMAFRGVAVAGLLNTLPLRGTGLSLWEAALAMATFLVFAAERLWIGRRLFAEQTGDERSLIHRRDDAERHVWMAAAIVGCGIAYLLLMGVLTVGSTMSLFAPLVGGLLLWCIARLATDSEDWSFLTRPFLRTGLALPLLTVFAGTIRHVTLPAPEWLGINSIALLAAAAFYFWRGLEKRTPSLLAGSAAILNIAFILLWRELSFSDPQFFMIPLGLSLLGLVELLKPQIPARFIDPLRYVGALTILVSPTFHIVGGSWLHLLTLMVASVLITLLAIGLRVRALTYAGTAFLAADLVAMVVRGSIDNTNLLWIAGIGIGAAVIGLAAYCERHREDMLQRLRMIAAELQTWD